MKNIMSEKITIRLNKELLTKLKNMQIKRAYSLSGLIREALREKLTEIKSIDNSLQVIELEKEKRINEDSI